MSRFDILNRSKLLNKLQGILRPFNKSGADLSSEKGFDNRDDAAIIQSIINNIRTESGIDDMRRIDLYAITIPYCIRTGKVCIINKNEDCFTVNGIKFSYTAK